MNAEMKTHHVLHQGCGIAVRRMGAGAETIIFIHADFVDSRMWDAVVQRLPAGYTAVQYDKLGYGASERAPGPMCRRRELSDVLESMGAGPFHLVGCSNGGQQALDYALENPGRVRSLVLVNSTPSGWQPEGAPPQEILQMLAALQEGRIEDANEIQTRIWFDGPSRDPESLDSGRLAARALAKKMNRIFLDNNTFAAADMNPRDPLDPPAINRLAHVAAPVLVVSGGLDYADNRRAGRVLAEGIPGARLVVMKGCAHVPPMEEPEEFAGLLGEFLGGR